MQILWLAGWRPDDPDQHEVSVLAEQQSLRELESAEVLREFWGQNDANLAHLMIQSNHLSRTGLIVMWSIFSDKHEVD